ncbi:Txe/YoeB family addiction module toxin [Bacteroidales bacterium OttesenSCG-928-B11]|nr:Txe/YoeB family addiction module toxin [Bacteroidales bacterium OttesenSCG-928-C03]MDL2312628.1 Txe/YoeB family addiction module toxin [Bacteroidales bacterium OttesenSCG-928-B11]
MEIILKDEALLDLEFWKKSGNKQIQKKISELISDISEHPEIGLGKPEKLKHKLTGAWSRRINSEHRIIYEVHENEIHILSMKGHYQ